MYFLMFPPKKFFFSLLNEVRILLLSYYYLNLLDNLLFVSESCKGNKYQRRTSYSTLPYQYVLSCEKKITFSHSLNTNLKVNVGFLLNDNNNTCFPGCYRQLCWRGTVRYKKVIKFSCCVSGTVQLLL